jgi:hypothetical protein
VKQVKVAQILGSDDKRRSRSIRGASGDADQYDTGIDDANRRLSKA